MNNRIEGAYPTIDFGEITSRLVMDMKKQEETYICEMLMQLNIDKDVLLKQAQEINRLNAELEKYRWIPVEERLPEEAENPITLDFYEYPVTYCINGVIDVRYRRFGRGHWWNMFFTCDEYVIAWMPLPEPYKEQMKGETNED